MLNESEVKANKVSQPLRVLLGNGHLGSRSGIWFLSGLFLWVPLAELFTLHVFIM